MLVLCSGMIRSGSTLQFNIVRNLVEILKVGVSNGYIGDFDVEKVKGNLIRWSADRQYHTIKMHKIPDDVDLIAGEDNLRICYIYRDIRDVAASAKLKWRLDERDLMDALDKAVTGYSEIIGRKRALIQKYENVVKDVPRAVHEIATFLSLNACKDVIKTIMQECSLENTLRLTETIENTAWIKVKKKLRILAKRLLSADSYDRIRAMAPRLRVYDQKTLLHPDHISKYGGAVGVW